MSQKVNNSAREMKESHAMGPSQMKRAKIGSSSGSGCGDPSPEITRDSASADHDGKTDSAAADTVEFYDAEQIQEFHSADGGCAAWLVCLTSFCTNGTIFSVINSFGIISEWLIAKYGASKSMAGAIGSSAIGCLFFFSFFASILTDRLGIRPVAVVGGFISTLGLLCSSFCDRTDSVSLLLLTHSFLFGAGAALVYTPSLVILGHYFERRMGLVNGIVTLGSGVFSVPLTHVMKPILLDKIGLANTFRLLASLNALIVLYALTWNPTRPARHIELNHYLSPRNSLVESVSGIGTFLAKFCNVSIWRSRGFLVWIAASPLAMVGYFVPFAFLPNFLRQRALLYYNITSDKQLKAILDGSNNNSSAGSGSSSGGHAELQRQIRQSMLTAESEAAMLLICINMASNVAKLAVGKLADCQCVNRIHMQQVAFATLGVSMLLLPPSQHRVLLILLAILFGLCDGAIVCLTGPIAFDLVGPSGASQAIGFLLMAMSPPTALGPLLAGYINDVTDRWDISFYASGVLPIVAAMVMCAISTTTQTYPAVVIAENFDQTAKSNLDIAYNATLAKESVSAWTRVSNRGSMVIVGSDAGGRVTRRSLPLELSYAHSRKSAAQTYELKVHKMSAVRGHTRSSV